MSPILTFDLGTSFFKAGVFEESGRLRALARTATPGRKGAGGRSEISPPRFFESLRTLAAQLRQQDVAGLESVGWVTFATQTNSFVLLDREDTPLTPIILWNDHRVDPRQMPPGVDRLSNDPDLYEQTGVARMSPQFMAAKLAWLRQREPEVWSRRHRLCLISDFLTLWLTGRHATEAGTAGLTGLVNIHQPAWRDEPVRMIGLEQANLPEVARAGTPLGTLRNEAREALGLKEPATCVAGCLDQYAGAIGAGNVWPGGISETTGTVLATVRLARGFNPSLGEQGVFQGPAFRPGWYWRMSFGGVSGQLLEALRQEFSPNPSYERLSAEAAAVPPGAEGLRLDGPASSQAARPVFVNASPRHGRGHRVRAIMEGVAVALKEQVNRLGEEKPASLILAAGGAARSDLWLNIKASTVGASMAAVACEEPTCLGAALLALSHAGGESVSELAPTRVHLRTTETGDARRCSNTS